MTKPLKLLDNTINSVEGNKNTLLKVAKNTALDPRLPFSHATEIMILQDRICMTMKEAKLRLTESNRFE